MTPEQTRAISMIKKLLVEALKEADAAKVQAEEAKALAHKAAGHASSCYARLALVHGMLDTHLDEL